ncbi:MAG: NAD(P)/FAD-dependent oxidoreductase [Bacteroidetes bacterium]|nr:NAD(P)/FAD-dependent oxidoreductase [Bacteroidota bacterium]
MSTNAKREVVIIGGGFGGIKTAKMLAKADVNITLIDKTNHHLFQPLLYQVATAALSPGDIAVPIRAIFSKQKNVKVMLGEVVEVLEQQKVVRLKDDRLIPFDTLVVACGAKYNYFGNTAWEKHAPGLKTISNALNIRERILMSLEKADQIESAEERQKYLNFVVIGGGPTGVEMAGAIAEIAKRNMMRDYNNFSPDQTHVYLIEAGPRILNGYDETLSEKAVGMLQELGVEVLQNTPVTNIERDKIFLVGSVIESPNIIWAAGVVANAIIKTLDVETDRAGRAIVAPDMSLPRHRDIFVIGDAAHMLDDKGNPLPAIAPVAMQQGKYVASLLKDASKYNAAVREPFRYLDKGSMATIGRARAVADIRGFKVSGFFAWAMWSVIHILFLIGFRNRLHVFVEWMWHYFTYKRGVRLITDRPGDTIGHSELETNTFGRGA